ncbi:single-stranded-DNA-specific exonuclease RecJ [Caldalkalibacillus mannanilyticus]|uniref:single-stranded-DNA-specific exonuclease RecJ n=1 Tax=Caldalkalibacillus mannanilyticus TaxID=1418 RepID=UPI000687A2BD|nr:DHHA1 domain-containing protein [Caldalkalibacillus mannanilyticus]
MAGLADQLIDEQKVGFSLGPRINASGRLESAVKAVQLLISTDPDEASILAEDIDHLNKQRQATVDEITKEAIEWVEERYSTLKPKALVVAKENWNVGVIGIVASRLVERYYVPTIVLGIDTETGKAKGSARSIEGFDMYKALTECKDLLPHFGGHPMAAGMTLAANDLEELRERMALLSEKWLNEEDFIPVTAIDIESIIEEIDIEAIQELGKLAPFGVDNPKPTILLNNVKLKEMRGVGSSQQHLKCQFSQEAACLDGIGFGLGDLTSLISHEARVDVIGQLEINEWNGMKKPQIMIRDMRVEHRQFFDWRGVKNLQDKWEQLRAEEQMAVCFCREKHAEQLNIPAIFISSDGIRRVLFM